MSAINLTSENFDEMISEGSVLVDFWAEWCGPCRILGPVIDELAVEYEGRAIVAKVNVDNERTLAKRFSVMSIPLVIIFQDGVEVNRHVGVRNKKTYTDDLG